MSDTGSRSGGCLCGAVRFTATPTSGFFDACHCGVCRRWSGGVFLATMCDGAVFDVGKPAAYSSSDYGERLFCSICGSSLMFRTKDGSATAVSLQAFDDFSGLGFAEEIFIDEKPESYAFANETQKLTGEEFFARWANQETPGG